MTFSWGCMTADSAEMGRRRTLFSSLRSTMTTCFVSLSSRTQMKRSEVMVRVANPIEAGSIPSAVSCTCSWNWIGRSSPILVVSSVE